MNLSHLDRAVGNFRINIFRQRGTISLVIRFVRSHIPAFDELRLPPVLLNVVMEKRGLVLIAGATGSGKSTTLAAMIDYRNNNKSGHILTIEDPIEYLFEHKQSIVNQRELDIDTQIVPEGARKRAARGARPHHDRRDPRPRDDAAGAAAYADRPPVPVDASTRTTATTRCRGSSTCSRTTRARACCPTCRSACARSSAQRLVRNTDGEHAARRRDPAQHVAHRRAHQERRDHADQGSDGAVALSRIADLRAGAVPPVPRRRTSATTRR